MVGNMAYLTKSEHAKNMRYIEGKEADRWRKEELDRQRRKHGTEKYIKPTNFGNGLYGSEEKQVDKSRDVNDWMKTDETRFEDVNQRSGHFKDHVTPKDTEDSTRRVTGVAAPTRPRTRHRDPAYAHGHGRVDPNKPWSQDGRHTDGDTSPTRDVSRPRMARDQDQIGSRYPYDHPEHQSGAGYSSYSSQTERSYYDDEELQQQETMQRQRSIQASMQMAYSVFGNVITALETYEGREARRARYTAPRKSNIPIPDQAFKNDEDVKASLMSQLKVFETHLQFCPKQVRDDVTSDMKIMVAQWLSARDDPKRFAPTKTDHYAARLFEILAKGSTTHADFSKHQKVMGRTELMSNFQKVMKGQAKADDLDRSFRDDPRKTASRPDVRRGTDINKGLRRIDLCNAALSPYTKELKEPSTRIR